MQRRGPGERTLSLVVKRAKNTANYWETWHPHSYLIEDEDWIADLSSRAKSWHDPTTEIGDIIKWVKTGGVKFYRKGLICPECGLVTFDELDFLQHVREEHLWTRKMLEGYLERAGGEVEITWSTVTAYYEAILPREPPIHLPGVEVNLEGGRGRSLYPSFREREDYQREAVGWRRRCHAYKGKPRLERFPNGTFKDRSGDVWLYLPQVLYNNRWVPASESDCLNWANLDLKRRVLYLLLITPW